MVTDTYQDKKTYAGETNVRKSNVYLEYRKNFYLDSLCFLTTMQEVRETWKIL